MAHPHRFADYPYSTTIPYDIPGAVRDLREKSDCRGLLQKENRPDPQQLQNSQLLWPSETDTVV